MTHPLSLWCGMRARHAHARAPAARTSPLPWNAPRFPYSHPPLTPAAWQMPGVVPVRQMTQPVFGVAPGVVGVHDEGGQLGLVCALAASSRSSPARAASSVPAPVLDMPRSVALCEVLDREADGSEHAKIIPATCRRTGGLRGRRQHREAPGDGATCMELRPPPPAGAPPALREDPQAVRCLLLRNVRFMMHSPRIIARRGGRAPPATLHAGSICWSSRRAWPPLCAQEPAAAAAAVVWLHGVRR